MKKIISFILVIFMSLSLTSCYNDLQRNSLDEYIARISKGNEGSKCGFSSTSIDNPEYFLPSSSFLNDYKYLEGTFFWREDDPWRGAFSADEAFPEIALLTLKYDATTYEDAKQTMLEEMKPYNDKFYYYNEYNFYLNSNNFDIINSGKSRFPENFTMACYNDENYTLIFMGLYSGTLAGPSCLDEKYLEDIEGNWEAFVDQYYGAYYDFSQ